MADSVFLEFGSNAKEDERVFTMSLRLASLEGDARVLDNVAL